MDFVAPNKFLILQILHSIKNSPRGGRVFSCGNKKIELINLENELQILVLFSGEKNLGYLLAGYKQFFEHPQCDEKNFTINFLECGEGGNCFLEKYFFGDEKIAVQNCEKFYNENFDDEIAGGDWIFFDKTNFGKIWQKKNFGRGNFEFKRKMTKKECAEIFENWEKNSEKF